jgi:hypothetical protein
MSATEFDFAPFAAVVVSEREPVTAVADAHAEADAIRALAHAEGLTAGREEAVAELAPAASALEQVAHALHEAAAANAERLEAQAVDLALLLKGAKSNSVALITSARRRRRRHRAR